MQVMKFGADVIGDAARLRELARIVRSAGENGEPVVVICTALAGITDSLIAAARKAALGSETHVENTRRELWSRHRALAEKLVNDDWERETLYHEWAELLKIFDRITRSIEILGDYSPRNIDAVAALGERLIAHLFAVVLRQNGVAAQMVDATELIVTDEHYGTARPFLIETAERTRTRLRPLLQARIVPVVTGYTGATRTGVVTTLGRGGGDYSATLIGAALDADEVCLWTDVDGIMTADPKIVPDAHSLAELSFVEAAEIATLGAEVLHPRTLVPVAERGIPLRIRSALRPERPGTCVVTDPLPTGSAARAIISARGLSLLSVMAAPGAADRQAWTPDLAARALARLADAGVEILTFTESFSERSLTMAVRAADAVFARDCMAEVFEQERAAGILREIGLVSPVALVALISATNNDDLVPRTLASLGRAGAHVLTMARGTLASHISVLLPEAEVDTIVRTLHRDLDLG